MDWGTAGSGACTVPRIKWFGGRWEGREGQGRVAVLRGQPARGVGLKLLTKCDVVLLSEQGVEPQVRLQQQGQPWGHIAGAAWHHRKQGRGLVPCRSLRTYRLHTSRRSRTCRLCSIWGGWALSAAESGRLWRTARSSAAALLPGSGQ
jgi:hypothetical protein